MATVYVLAGIELILGILLCLRGLSIYRIIQIALCALIGAYIGMRLEYAIGSEWLYIVAGILAIVGGYLGYRYYRITFYVVANIIAFVVSFSVYWKRAVEAAEGGLGEVLGLKQVFGQCFQGTKSLSDVSNSINQVFLVSEQNIGNVFRESAGIIRTGLIVSVIIALIAGILAMWFGDYVVMIVTAAMGGAMMLSCACTFFDIPNMAYIITLIVIAGIGLYSQLVAKR